VKSRLPIADCQLPIARAAAESVQNRQSALGNRQSRSAGFSFTELLFAIMIMGIGFIMIAAIFPVGLAQTKSNFDETQAANLARAAVAAVQTNAPDAEFNQTGRAMPLQLTPAGTSVSTQVAESSMISPSDPRYAWVGFYRREPGSTFAQIIVLVLNRADPFRAFISGVNNDDTDIRPGNTAMPAVKDYRYLEPREVLIDATPDSVKFLTAAPASATHINHAQAAAPGAFVVISNDNITPANVGTLISVEEYDSSTKLWTAKTKNSEDEGYVMSLSNRLNGRVYRLGADVGSGKFDWFPGAGMEETFSYTNSSSKLRRITINSLSGATAYIVGRSRAGVQTFEGGPLDVAYYTTFISLRTAP